MLHLAIRCHPCVAVSPELEQWLETEAEKLRTGASRASIRLSRLTQSLPTTEVDIGWLLELDVLDGDAGPGNERIAAVLMDMRLLGLQPTVLAAGGTGPGAPGGEDPVTELTRHPQADGDGR